LSHAIHDITSCGTFGMSMDTLDMPEFTLSLHYNMSFSWNFILDLALH